MSKTSERKASTAERDDARRRAQAYLDAMTDDEDARITSEALADPDALPAEDLLRRKLGRPPSPPEVKKVPVTIKLDPDVVAQFRASGPRLADQGQRRPAQGRRPEVIVNPRLTDPLRTNPGRDRPG